MGNRPSEGSGSGCRPYTTLRTHTPTLPPSTSQKILGTGQVPPSRIRSLLVPGEHTRVEVHGTWSERLPCHFSGEWSGGVLFALCRCPPLVTSRLCGLLIVPMLDGTSSRSAHLQIEPLPEHAVSRSCRLQIMPTFS